MKNSFSLITIALYLVFGINSCKKNEYKVSKYNESESHNMGMECMSCHSKGGSGEGWFNIAATVYDSTKATTFPNTTVKLFTGANGTGTLKYTIEVDAKGNFYSTESFDFSSGLYPAVQGNQTTMYMSSPVSSGNCASCHGNSTGRIWTK